MSRRKLPSALASILLIGQRADGTFATANLGNFLKVTRSFESAALLAIVNRPFDELFREVHFAALDVRGLGVRAIGGRGTLLGLSHDLRPFRLRASARSSRLSRRGWRPIFSSPWWPPQSWRPSPSWRRTRRSTCSSRPTIIGRRAMPLSPPELICLAVRMIHGIQPETVAQLDTTATAAPVQRVGVSGYGFGPGFFFLPAVVACTIPTSTTFSGMGGAHPGHAHFGGGGYVG